MVPFLKATVDPFSSWKPLVSVPEEPTVPSKVKDNIFPLFYHNPIACRIRQQGNGRRGAIGGHFRNRFR